jgi:hypothetical protein
MRVIDQPKANLFGPSLLTVGSIHSYDNRYVQQLVRIAAIQDGLDVLFGPAAAKWPHLMPNA